MTVQSRRGIGRPTKLRPQVRAAVLRTLRRTGSIEAACRVAGISASSFYRWKADGERQGSGEHWEFCREVEMACVEHQRGKLERVASGEARVCLELEAELERVHQRLIVTFKGEPHILERARSALFGEGPGSALGS